MPEAYTVSKMLSNINEVMAPVATDVCGSVTLQHRTENGVMLNTSEKEVAYLDMKAKIKHSAQQVAQLDQLAKAQWVATQRQVGNDAFYKGDYKQAAEAYIEALTALDFGSSAVVKITCQQEVQIPLTCNLAACMLMTEQWDKAQLICDQILAIDPNCVKALQQRAKSRAKLAKFNDARADVLRAMQVIRGPSTSRGSGTDERMDQLDKQLHNISRAERRRKEQLQQQKNFQKKMMQEAVGSLYSDKKEIDQYQNADKAFDTLLQNHAFFFSTIVAQSRDGCNACVRWSLAMLAMLINPILRFLIATREKVKT